jgi:hypothetical protein
MDILGVEKALKQINDETLPKIEALLAKLNADIQAAISRFDGLTITINLKGQNEIRNDLPVAACHESAADGADRAGGNA